MEQSNRILKAIANKDITTLTEHLHEGMNKTKTMYLKEMYEVLTKQDSLSYWNILKDNYFENIISVCFQITNHDNSEKQNNLDEKQIQNNLELIKSIANGILEYSQVSKYIPGSLFDIVNVIQSLLISTCSVFQLLTTIKSIISRISECWWINEQEGTENLVPNLITYLLLSSLDISGHDTDIKRLYPLRGAFLLLDFDDPSINFISSLINRCYVHPGYLKVVEGQKFLAFLLNVNKGLLIQSVSQIIRSQLTICVDVVSVAYGQILYRAWKESVATVTNEENQCNPIDNTGSTLLLEDSIQTLLKECIHASEIKYFKGLRTMLKSFHDIKRSDELNGMLLRVYDPILWRALRCANAHVRSQASIVFLDVFPLQHADGRAEEDDKILQKQFDLLSTLLKDNDHKVRANAVLGVCDILKQYWEVLPVNTTHNILKYIVDTLSSDSSCANVRYSLFVGLGVLFQQPLAHALLKQLLPLLKASIHDKSEKVRIAFIKILCQIKGIRGMHFYEIVEVEHLLERLAEDRNRPNVCKVMTELLLNSFYPQNTSTTTGELESEQLSRCMKFIEKNPRAAEAFYSNLHHFIPIGYVAKLITMVFTILISTSNNTKTVDTIIPEGNQKSKGKRVRGLGTECDVKTVTLEFPVKFGLFQVLLCLLESVSHQFIIQVPARELVCKYLTKERLDILVKGCTQQSTSEEVTFLLPIAFKITANSLMLQQMDVKTSEKSKESSNMNEVILNSYYPAWSNIFNSEHESLEKSDMMKSALAKSLINIVRYSYNEAHALYCILQSFQQASNNIVQESTISFGAAVDLLIAHDESISNESIEVSEEISSVIDDIILNLKMICENSLKSAVAHKDTSVSSIYLTKAMKFWLSRSLRIDIIPKLQNSNISEHEQFHNLHLITKWFTDKVFNKFIITYTKESTINTSIQYFKIILAVISDIFYLNLEDDRICNTLCNWFRTLQTTTTNTQGVQSSHKMVINNILPAILRIEKLMNLTTIALDDEVSASNALHEEILAITKSSLLVENIALNE